MSSIRLDPEHPRSVLFGTKLGKSDADRVIRLARREGVGKSEILRRLVLDALSRAEPEPPTKAA